MGLSGLAARGTPHPGSITAAPVAGFTGTPVVGGAPFAVVFTDTSGRTPTSWLWQKNSGSGWVNFAGTPTVQNPTETFQQGEWSVRLTATNAGGGTTYTRTDYINATDLAPTVLSTTVAANGVTVTRVFSEAVTGFQNGWGDFGLSDGSVRHGTDYTSGNGTATIVFTCEDNLYQGTTYTDEYAVGGGNITDLAGNALAIYTGAAVTNNSTQFTPANIPGLVFYRDFTGPLYQNINGTTAATTTGDPVGAWGADWVAFANSNTRPTLTTTGGPASGKSAVVWDGTNNRPMYYPSATWFAGTELCLFAVFKSPSLPAGSSRVFGRGEYNGNGTCITVQTDGSIKYFLTGQLTPWTQASNTGDQTGNWVVAALAYGSGTIRFKVRGFSLLKVFVDDGALKFDGADTAAWVGGAIAANPAGGGAFYDAKGVALYGFASVSQDDTSIATLVDNLATYCGIP